MIRKDDLFDSDRWWIPDPRQRVPSLLTEAKRHLPRWSPDRLTVWAWLLSLGSKAGFDLMHGMMLELVLPASRWF